MNKTEILQKALDILQRYEGPGQRSNTVTESTALVEDLNINSARMVDIVIELEDQFRITIDDSELEKLVTVSDVVELINAHLNAQKTT